MSSKPSDPLHPDETITISELIQKQNDLENEAAEVLPFDITQCSKPLGHIKQSVYSCLTCNPIDPNRPGQHTRAGICSSCSVSCHTDHQLVELFIRRNFQCDCGTDRCNSGQCSLINPSSINSLQDQDQDQIGTTSTTNTSSVTTTTIPITNKYDKNFDGQFCLCERGKNYNPETETEDMYQCLACEDWRHDSCLGPRPDPDDWDDLICANCVQNDPRIRTILFKHVGGDGIGMMVCTNSGTTAADGSNQIISYGSLLKPKSPQADHKLNQSSGTQTTSSSIETVIGSKIQEQEKRSNDLFIQSPLTNPKKTLVDSHTPAYHSTSSTVASLQPEADIKKQPERLPSSNNQLVEQTTKPQDSLLDHKRKRGDEDEPITETVISDSNTVKKLRVSDEEKLKSKGDLTCTSFVEGGEVPIPCQAPFKDLSESILAKIDPKFSNVYLTCGWRNRWCNCSDCLSVLNQVNWLAQEEPVWEPGHDSDSLKPIHELGLEALKNLPRDQLVNGLMAYNKLKEEMLEFLKPFESNNCLVTELDIKRFFLNTKSKILNQTW